MERWKKNLTTLWISQVISLTSFGFGIPFIPFFIQELGVNDPEQLKIYTSLLSGAPAITMALMSPIWGILSDRFGQKLMIQRAMLAAVFIIGAMGFAKTVLFLVLLRFLQGFFTGTITASSAFVAVNTPNDKLSYSLGILSSSTFVGYSLGPLLGGLVAEKFGYRASFFVGGALMLLGFLIVTFFLKGEKKPAIQMNNAKRTSEQQPSKQQPSKNRPSEKGLHFLTGSIMILLVMLFLQRIIRTLFTPFIPLYVQEITQHVEGAASTTGMINGLVGFVTAASAILISRLGDRYDKMWLIRVMLIMSALDVLMLNLTSGMWAFVVFYTLLFLIIGGVEPLITSTTAEMTQPEKRGTLFGIQGLVGSLGWMVSPVIGGYVSVVWGIRWLFWVLFAFLLMNIVVGLIIKKRNEGDEHVNR